MLGYNKILANRFRVATDTRAIMYTYTAVHTSCSTIVLLQILCPCVNQMHVVVSLGIALHIGSRF